jgi:hypothetical protein
MFTLTALRQQAIQHCTKVQYSAFSICPTMADGEAICRVRGKRQSDTFNPYAFSGWAAVAWVVVEAQNRMPVQRSLSILCATECR